MPPTRWTGHSVARLRVRWTKDPKDKAVPGEALVRLFSVRASQETHPAVGRAALQIAVSGTTGEASWSGPSEPTDLHLLRMQLQMSVETADGRRLVARFDPDLDAPQIGSDANADLQDALNRAWSAKRQPGRQSEQAARIDAIIDKAAESVDTATKLSVAQALGRVKQQSDWYEMTSQYKEDVKAAGGWPEIMRRAYALA